VVKCRCQPCLLTSAREDAAYGNADGKGEEPVDHLSLEGDAYKIGRQHGESLRSLIRSALGPQVVCTDREAFQSRAVLERRAEFLRTRFPDLMSEIEGIADGADVPLEEILRYNLSPLPSACSNVAFVSADGPLLGHVNDDREHRFDVAFRVRYGTGRELLHIGIAGSVGTAAALNSAGLAVSHAAARSAGLTNPQAHFNLPVLRRALVDACDHCQEARSFLLAHSFSSGADNIIAIDKSGAAFIAEKLPTAVAFREPQGEAIYCTGRALDQEIRRRVGQEIYEKEAPDVHELIGRERYFQAVIDRNKGRLSFHLMAAVLCHAEEGAAVCNDLSNWATILLPHQFQAFVAGRPPGPNTFEPLHR